MNDELRKTIGVLGAASLVAAVVGGRVKLAGSEFPGVGSPVRQVLLAAIGVLFLILALGRWPGRPTTFLVEQKMASITSVVGTTWDGEPLIRTAGGGIKTRRIEAVSYSRSDDGKRYTFKNWLGRVVCELPSHQVNTIRRAGPGE